MEGYTPPKSKAVVSVVFAPEEAMELQGLVECAVEDGPDCYISVHATVDYPRLVLRPSILRFQNGVLGSPQEFSITLTNPSLVPAHYCFMGVNTDEEKYSIALAEPQGILAPSESRQQTLQITPFCAGQLHALLSCLADGSEETQGIAVTGMVGNEVVFAQILSVEGARGALVECLSIYLADPSYFHHPHRWKVCQCPWMWTLELPPPPPPPPPPTPPPLPTGTFFRNWSAFQANFWVYLTPAALPHLALTLRRGQGSRTLGRMP